MSILIKTVRIAGFRGLKNIEVMLEQTTILTGMNNTGKTSFLKALQLALGNRQFISQDDFFIPRSSDSEKIIIDLLIIPIGGDGKRCKTFSTNWEILFTTKRIGFDTGNEDYTFVSLRTIISFDKLNHSYNTQQFIQQDWPKFQQDGVNWSDVENGNETSFYFDEIPFLYMDAQRDILEDTNLKNSYLGRMLSKVDYTKDDTKDIEAQIKLLNEKAVSSSDILSILKITLKELDSAMDTQSAGIEITPFTKKIRDLNKGLTIYYADNQESFSMEYHGMGTRSWSSLLTLKAFITLLLKNAEEDNKVFFPILAIEEPEAHLHPNAQKKLFGQIDAIPGQKIISTHSPYIAATAKLEQIRNFYKDDTVSCGMIEKGSLTEEDIRKINRQVINTRGEIFFSKLLIFFEGETEEQALPIFAQQYFGKTSVEMGLDFVGVGGNGNYSPFLHFAVAFHIPFLIFSDADNNNIKKSVQKQFLECKSEKNETDYIVFLDDGNDFENYLITCGYIKEIESALINLYSKDYLEEQIKKKDGTNAKRIKTDKTCNVCNQSIYKDILRDYSGDEGFKRALYDCMILQKTQFGPVIAEQIIQSKKGLPPKVITLFRKISDVLKLEEARL